MYNLPPQLKSQNLPSFKSILADKELRKELRMGQPMTAKELEIEKQIDENIRKEYAKAGKVYDPEKAELTALIEENVESKLEKPVKTSKVKFATSGQDFYDPNYVDLVYRKMKKTPDFNKKLMRRFFNNAINLGLNKGEFYNDYMKNDENVDAVIFKDYIDRNSQGMQIVNDPILGPNVINKTRNTAKQALKNKLKRLNDEIDQLEDYNEEF